MSDLRSRYKPHPGSDHEWSLPVAELGGRRACRKCAHVATGREDFFDVRRALRKKEIVA